MIAQGSYFTTNYYSIVDHITPVLSVFSKSGGKNGKHGWVPQVTTITSASNIAIQVFQSLGHRRFRVSHSTMASNLCIKRFRLLASAYFLCALTNVPKFYNSDTFLEISEDDARTFSDLLIHQQHVISAVKASIGRKKEAEDNEEE
jgi:hypothetical protein